MFCLDKSATDVPVRLKGVSKIKKKLENRRRDDIVVRLILS